MAQKKISATGFDKNGKAYKYHFPLNKLNDFENYAVKHQMSAPGKLEKLPFVYANYYIGKTFLRRVWFQHFGKYKK